MGSILNIEAVIGDASDLELSAPEIEDILAVAYLAMQADGRLRRFLRDLLEMGG